MRARPAETITAGAGGIASLIALLGFNDHAAAAALWAVGALPTAVTWIVANGGVRGTARALWRGRAR